MSYTLGQAAKATGKSKATISRAIHSGRLSAVKDEASGEYKIDPSELHRVFDPVSSTQAQNGGLKQSETAGETALLRVQLEQERQERQRERVQLEGTIDDLRRRLDREAEERRRLTALLTDQRAKPSDVIVPPPPETAPAAIEPTPPQRKGWRRLFG
jgi:excisionase family DNA binding protein